MSRSAIYAVNTTTGTSLAAGATYVPSTVIRRFGQNAILAGNGILLRGEGYYSIDATVTVNAAAASEVTLALYQDGQPIQGATATAVAAAIGDQISVPLTAMVKLNCNCMESVITVVAVTAATTNNLAIRVVKE